MLASPSHSSLGDQFVGRAGELEALREEFKEAKLRRPRLVLIEGPAGIGKTQLVRRFLADHANSSQRPLS